MSSDLQDTIECLRQEKSPDLPGELVCEILQIEANFVHDRTEAVKRIRKAVEEYLVREER